MYETAEKTDACAEKATCGSRAEPAQLEQAENLVQRALEDKLRGAYSIESRAGHEPGLERLPVMLIGTVFRKAAGRLYELYEDTEGNLWYQVRIRKNGEWLTETEAVFGKEKRKGSG